MSSGNVAQATPNHYREDLPSVLGGLIQLCTAFALHILSLWQNPDKVGIPDFASYKNALFDSEGGNGYGYKQCSCICVLSSRILKSTEIISLASHLREDHMQCR